MNIYFSGPDGTGKSKLSYMLSDFLNKELGIKSVIVHFPSFGPAGALIGLHKEGRTKFHPLALDMLFVADRLDKGAGLRKIREQDPNTIFIFDRGHIDGAVYGAARISNEFRPEDYVEWLLGCDLKFIEMFPPDLGFILFSEVEESRRMMVKKMGSDFQHIPDSFDTNQELQLRVRQNLQMVIPGLDRDVWRVIVSHPLGDFSREFSKVKLFVEEKIKERRVGPERLS